MELLPKILRGLAWLVPQTYVIAAMRRTLKLMGAQLPGITLSDAGLGLVVFNAIAFPFAIWPLGRAIDAGRTFGVLSAYCFRVA